MESIERCRIILGLSSNNTEKLALLQIYLDKAREDIEAFCRDTFKITSLNNEGVEVITDTFPNQLKSVQEDLALARWRKREAEGYTSRGSGDESTAFDSYFPDSIKQRLYPFTRLIPRR